MATTTERQELEILSKAAAWFARETGSIPSKGSNPDNLDELTGTPSDGTFEGVILQELGIFIGDPE
jgi:hypothetical protein